MWERQGGVRVDGVIALILSRSATSSVRSVTVTAPDGQVVTEDNVVDLTESPLTSSFLSRIKWRARSIFRASPTRLSKR